MSSQETIWPSFFVVGPPKAGTTSLYTHLKKHPQVFLPEVKEPNFFATGHTMTQEEYRRLYRKAAGYTAVGDMSPYYLWDENSPRYIHEAVPGARIIAILRDPVARAFSHYLMYVRKGADPEPSFEKALRRLDNQADKLWDYSNEYVGLGMYCGQVQRYLDVFGANQVLVMLFEDLIHNPQEFSARIAKHIGVDPGPLAQEDLGEARTAFRTPRFGNLYSMVRDSRAKQVLMRYLPERVQNWLRESPVLYGQGNRPVLDDASRKLLQGIYDPDIGRLEKLLGRNLPELRKSWA
jgi:hypothetical protein